jgi:hypothetical protein
MEAMHSQDLSIMVAIACGTRKQVRHWGEILREAAIDYLVAEGVENLPEDANALAEVWVFQVDADEARASLRRSGRDGDSNLW